VHLGDALHESFYSLGQLVDSTVACLLIFGKFLKPSLVLLGEFTQASVGLGGLLNQARQCFFDSVDARRHLPVLVGQQGVE
jgi:hypothetical protein